MMDFNSTLNYLEEGLYKWGFSLRSLVIASISRGIIRFLISSIQSGVKVSAASLLSSKVRTGFAFFLRKFTGYLFFFWPLTASFILPMASSWGKVLDFFKSSHITPFGSLSWSNGLEWSWVTEDFITHKDAKNSGVKLIYHIEEILKDFPKLNRQDIYATLDYAANEDKKYLWK